PAFEAVEISDLSLNDNPTRAIRTLHRSDPRRPGVLLRRYDTTQAFFDRYAGLLNDVRD
ncbi:hypothetical protein FAM15190_002092, partial [Propionibacterium freudenreichii]|nr:hypothetical protein [Propionibacterium freudenreichii]